MQTIMNNLAVNYQILNCNSVKTPHAFSVIVVTGVTCCTLTVNCVFYMHLEAVTDLFVIQSKQIEPTRGLVCSLPLSVPPGKEQLQFQMISQAKLKY